MGLPSVRCGAFAIYKCVPLQTNADTKNNLLGETMSEDNCGGQCCERFIIGKTMEEIKKEYINWKEACEGTPMVMNGKPELRGTF
jgi:hypothetical protein